MLSDSTDWVERKPLNINECCDLPINVAATPALPYVTRMNNELYNLALDLGARLKSAALTVACAESCTGGGIAHAITAIPGSSAWFEMGFVTYSNEAKTSLLGLSTDVLLQHGAVSEAVVSAMAEGARNRAGADLAVAVSGIAGPDGGSVDKPVGTVWLAWTWSGGVETRCCQFKGDREQVREQAIKVGLEGLLGCSKKLS